MCRVERNTDQSQSIKMEKLSGGVESGQATDKRGYSTNRPFGYVASNTWNEDAKKNVLII